MSKAHDKIAFIVAAEYWWCHHVY